MHEYSLATVAQLGEFDEAIDVRSETEYAEDHVPGALNCPVLSDAERALVGTIYKQVSAFEAKKVGAALVSRNIARHIDATFAQRPRHWRPLVYCWRGGSRSAALTHVLQQIGWRARQLDGGYKAYRRQVVADLATLPLTFRWHVLCGLTGSGKSRLLRELASGGAQVLDLEALAAHRGSVLGNLLDEAQPTQKLFDSLTLAALRKLDPAQPVFVEAESRKIGNLRVPEALMAAMWRGECICLETGIKMRVAALKQEYGHFLCDPGLLGTQLDLLNALYGTKRIEQWKALAQSGDWDGLVRQLLETHYDPAYTRSTLKHYPQLPHAMRLELAAGSESELKQIAARCRAHAR